MVSGGPSAQIFSWQFGGCKKAACQSCSLSAENVCSEQNLRYACRYIHVSTNKVSRLLCCGAEIVLLIAEESTEPTSPDVKPRPRQTLFNSSVSESSGGGSIADNSSGPAYLAAQCIAPLCASQGLFMSSCIYSLWL